MKYNEYKAPEGKVLFNLENFTYGNTIYSVHNLNLMILDEEEANALSQEYQAEQSKVMEEKIITFTGDPQPDVSLMSLNDEDVYEETEEVNPMEAFKRDKISYLLSKGIPFNPSDIQKIEHNTVYI